MKYAFVILLLTSCQLFAQRTIDPGCVKAEPNFCKDKDSSSDNICNSKYEIEIRMTILEIRKLRLDESLIILTYGDSNWMATKYNYVLEDGCTPQARYVIGKGIPLESKKGFSQVFEDLIANEVFNLPNQTDIFPDTAMNGGIAYHITFKVGQSYRYYFFFNPDEYMKISSRKEFIEYKNIADIFREQLVPK